MIKIDKNNVLNLQQLVIKQTGGRAGLRDPGLLDSAVESVYQTFDGKELYPSNEEKAARLGYNLVANHAFVDGNKRIGILVMLSFLEVNGINIKYTDEELIQTGMSLANGKMKYNGLLKWINCHKSHIEQLVR